MRELQSWDTRQKICAQVIAKAWQSEKYKEQFLKNPDAVMKEAGLKIPEGKHIKVVENTESIFYFLLPKKPDKKENEMSAENLTDKMMHNMMKVSLSLDIQPQLFAKMTDKAWHSKNYKEQLLKNPDAVLKESGIQMPEGIHFKVVEDTESIFHFILPVKPGEKEISEEDLRELSGGWTTNIASC